jgi:hypothetical protein
MKAILRLAVLAVAGTTALALAGTGLATQKLIVNQSATSLAIKLTQAQSDPQPAKIQIFVPSAYTINASQAPGTKIGTATGTVFARDQRNVSLPLSGDIVTAPPNTNAPDCATGTHLAVWLLDLEVADQRLQVPVHVDATTGVNAAFGAYQLVVCFPPSDVPQGTPGRAPNGAQVLETTLTLNNVFTVPVGENVWKTLTTPYTPATGLPNAAGTVESRSFVGTGTVTIATRVTNKKKRILRISGKVTQAGGAVAGAQVRLLLNGKLPNFAARSNAVGNYTIVLRKTGKKSTTTFQARVTAGERDVTSIACASPTLPALQCVSATSSGFTALSRKVRIHL